MRIDKLIADRREPVFSFEFFPPRTPAGERNLFDALAALRELEPAFVSVTKTGSATQVQTIELVARIRDEHGIEAVPHFTCVGASEQDLRESLRVVREAQLENMLALRGDPPPGAQAFLAADGGFAHANELVALASGAEFELCAVAACYPETHVEAPDRASDLARLREKVTAGARVLITQLFFSNAAYFEFVREARDCGIDVPIVPGIMPITNAEQITRFTAMCGASIPPPLRQALDVRAEEPEAVAELGVAYATLQCAELLAAGVPGIHFYTLNRSPATRAILSSLRLARPWETDVSKAYVEPERATVDARANG
jgi:methylenetetrahydrofolate reductase (NADPH)